MFAAWSERESAAFVADKCGVHHRTVDRYRVADRWDERLKRVRTDAQAEVDYTIARAMAESLRIVRVMKTKLGEAIERKRVTSNDVSVADLERLVRLEAFILGGAESRHEVRTEFTGWSEAELETYASSGELPGKTSGGPSRA